MNKSFTKKPAGKVDGATWNKVYSAVADQQNGEIVMVEKGSNGKRYVKVLKQSKR